MLKPILRATRSDFQNTGSWRWRDLPSLKQMLWQSVGGGEPHHSLTKSFTPNPSNRQLDLIVTPNSARRSYRSYTGRKAVRPIKNLLVVGLQRIGITAVGCSVFY